MATVKEVRERKLEEIERLGITEEEFDKREQAKEDSKPVAQGAEGEGSADEFIRAREKEISKISAGQVPTKREREAGTATVAAQFAEQERLERESQRIGLAQEATEDLRTGLQEKIANPLDLEPPPFSESLKQPVAQAGLAIGGIGELFGVENIKNHEEFQKTKLGETMGLIVAASGIGAAVGIAGAAGVAVVTTVAAAKISTGAALALYFGANKLWNALSGDVIGGKVTDVNRNRIESAMSGIGNIAGQSSTTQSAVQNGMDSGVGLQTLRNLDRAVDDAERTVQELAIYNFKYAQSDDFATDMQKIKDARLNIQERVEGIANIVATGNAKLNPELLMMDMERLKEFEV